MVDQALSLGAGAGVVLSAAFVYWEVGRYAAPQVPRSQFDERKVMIAYTAGLFAGIPLAIPLLFLFQAIPPFALGGIAFYLTLLVAGSELAEWALFRSRYFGQDGSGPFYAIGMRSGIGGLLVLALVTQYFSGPTATAAGIAGLLSVSVGVVLLESAAAVLAVPGSAAPTERRSGPWSAVPLEAFGFFVLGLALGSGPAFAIAGGILIAVGAVWVYRTVGPPMLRRIHPPGEAEGSEPRARGPFDRTDRPGGADPAERGEAPLPDGSGGR